MCWKDSLQQLDTFISMLITGICARWWNGNNHYCTTIQSYNLHLSALFMCSCLSGGNYILIYENANSDFTLQILWCYRRMVVEMTLIMIICGEYVNYGLWGIFHIKISEMNKSCCQFSIKWQSSHIDHTPDSLFQ